MTGSCKLNHADKMVDVSSLGKCMYVNKWLSNEQINQKLSNQLWKSKHVSDTQITQTLKLDLHNTWATIEKIYFGPSNTKIPIVHYAKATTETHGPTYYEHAKIHT